MSASAFFYLLSFPVRLCYSSCNRGLGIQIICQIPALSKLSTVSLLNIHTSYQSLVFQQNTHTPSWAVYSSAGTELKLPQRPQVLLAWRLVSVKAMLAALSMETVKPNSSLQSLYEPSSDPTNTEWDAKGSESLKKETTVWLYRIKLGRDSFFPPQTLFLLERAVRWQTGEVQMHRQETGWPQFFCHSQNHLWMNKNMDFSNNLLMHGNDDRAKTRREN